MVTSYFRSGIPGQKTPMRFGCRPVITLARVGEQVCCA